MHGNKPIELICLREHAYSVIVAFTVHGNKSMSAFLPKQPVAIAEYDESLVQRLVEKFTVYEGKFTVEFKSDVTVEWM